MGRFLGHPLLRPNYGHFWVCCPSVANPGCSGSPEIKVIVAANGIPQSQTVEAATVPDRAKPQHLLQAGWTPDFPVFLAAAQSSLSLALSFLCCPHSHFPCVCWVVATLLDGCDCSEYYLSGICILYFIYTAISKS